MIKQNAEKDKPVKYWKEGNAELMRASALAFPGSFHYNST